MSRAWPRALFLVLIALFVTMKCSIEKPVAPTWNLKLSVPLVHKHYDMATLIDKMDEPYLRTDSLGNPLFCFEEDLDTVRLNGKLRCDPESISFKDTLGVMNLNLFESRQLILNISDFYDGEPGDVPPCSTTIREDFEVFDDFSCVYVQEAFAGITVNNKLGLDLNLIRARLIDRNLGDTLFTMYMPSGIADGESLYQELVIRDADLSNELSIEISGMSLGGNLETLQDKFLLADFTLDSIKVIRGEVKVPSLELSQMQTLSLPTGSLIDSARIRSGNLTLRLQNFTHLESDVYINLPEIEKDGQTLFTACSLPALSSHDLSLSLDECSLMPLEGMKIAVQTRVYSPGSGNNLIEFQSSDSVAVEALLSEIIFSQVAGIVESTRVEIEPIQRVLDIPQGFESAQMANAELSMEIHNGVDLPANLSVDIHGDGGQNMNLSAAVEAGGPFGTAVTSIWEDDLGSLLSPVPDRITITGEIVYGDGQSSGICREEDFLFGVIRVSSPLELVWDACRIEMDKSSDEVDDDIKETIQDQLNSGKVILKMENHLPLGAEAKIYFSREESLLLSNPDLLIGPLTVSAGQLNHDGSVTASSFTETEIELSYEDLQVFTGTPFYMAGILDLPGTDGQSITALASDFIRITSYLELSVKNKKD